MNKINAAITCVHGVVPEKILSNINENLSGGAAFELLYFLTKKRKPKIIVETGVAAGWSTLAFLRASKYNKNVIRRIFILIL